MDPEAKVLATVALPFVFFGLARILYKRLIYTPITVQYERPGGGAPGAMSGIWSFELDGEYHEITESFFGVGPIAGMPGQKGVAYVNLKDTSKSITPSWKWHVFLLGSFGILCVLVLALC